MDVIKKKMQAMKLEKDNAMDKADTCEGQAKEANMRADKVLEEVAELTKKLAQVEADLEANKQALEQANKDLEDKEKALTNVSLYFSVFFCTVALLWYFTLWTIKITLKRSIMLNPYSTKILIFVHLILLGWVRSSCS